MVIAFGNRIHKIHRISMDVWGIWHLTIIDGCIN